MSQNLGKRQTSRRSIFFQVLVISIVINLIIILAPILPVSEVINCFASPCDPNITYESIWERYN